MTKTKEVIVVTNAETARMFKAFCDESRIAIIKLLTNEEKCACKLLEELKISQPTLSHHMKILCDSGIVTGRKEGKWMHYELNCAKFRQFKEFIGTLECSCSTERESGKEAVKESSRCCCTQKAGDES